MPFNLKTVASTAIAFVFVSYCVIFFTPVKNIWQTSTELPVSGNVETKTDKSFTDTLSMIIPNNGDNVIEIDMNNVDIKEIKNEDIKVEEIEEYNELIEMMKPFGNKLNKAQSVFDDVQEKIRNQTIEKRKCELEKELLIEQNKNLTNNVQPLKDEIKKHEETIKQNEEKIAELNATLSTETEKLNNMTTEREECKNELETKIAELTNKDEKINECETERNNLESQVNNFKEMEEQYNKLKADFDKLKDEKEIIEKNNEEQVLEIADLKNQIDNITLEKDELQNKYNELILFVFSFLYIL